MRASHAGGHRFESCRAHHIDTVESKVEPTLGAGAVYPINESEIVAPDLAIPEYWPRAYGMDVGWNRTAVVWGGRDPASGVMYLYSEHYQGQGEPASHAQAIRARGVWILGVIDPACLGSSQIDGRTLMEVYRKLGLHLGPAENAVEGGSPRCGTCWSRVN